MKIAYTVLESISSIDLSDIMTAKDNLSLMMEGMIKRNMQLKLFLDNSPLNAHLLDEPIKNIKAEINRNSTLRTKLGQLVDTNQTNNSGGENAV